MSPVAVERLLSNTVLAGSRRTQLARRWLYIWATKLPTSVAVRLPYAPSSLPDVVIRTARPCVCCQICRESRFYSGIVKNEGACTSLIRADSSNRRKAVHCSLSVWHGGWPRRRLRIGTPNCDSFDPESFVPGRRIGRKPRAPVGYVEIVAASLQVPPLVGKCARQTTTTPGTSRRSPENRVSLSATVCLSAGLRAVPTTDVPVQTAPAEQGAKIRRGLFTRTALMVGTDSVNYDLVRSKRPASILTMCRRTRPASPLGWKFRSCNEHPRSAAAQEEEEED